MKPTFAIAGCGKCGTTTLAYLLNQHPEVFVTQPKEPNFLSYDSVYCRGWQWYESLFERGKELPARGEASVSYSLAEYEAKVSARISQYLPDLRLIYIARNPFKRLESVYREHHDSGHQHGWHLPHTLPAAVAYRPQMLTNSLYWQRTAAFRSILPDSQLLYLCLEDLQENPDKILRKCFEFMGVDTSFIVDCSRDRLNEGSQKMYDTKLMRFMRNHQVIADIYEKFPSKVRQIFQPFLRKSFDNKTIDWELEFRDYFIEQMAEDVQNFLAACNKSPDFWGKEFI